MSLLAVSVSGDKPAMWAALAKNYRQQQVEFPATSAIATGMGVGDGQRACLRIVLLELNLA